MLYKTISGIQQSINPADVDSVRKQLLQVLATKQHGQNQDISYNEIYSAFVQKGGNHDLDLKDYNSFYAYTEAKKEIEDGQFFTDENIIAELMEICSFKDTDFILEPCFGKGSIINHLPENMLFNVSGCETDQESFNFAKYLFPECNLENMPFEYYNTNYSKKFDYIIMNPPFNLKIQDQNSQHFFITRSAEMLKESGIMLIICPETFLSDSFTDSGKIKEIMETNLNFIGQYQVKFKNIGIKTKVMAFFKGLDRSKIEIKYIDKESITKQIKEIRKHSKGLNLKHDKSFSFSNNHNYNQLPKYKQKQNLIDNFNFIVKKYLFDIKQTRSAEIYYNCLQYIEKFNNQVIPSGMKFDEWDKIKITELKVLSHLKHYLYKSNKIKKTQNMTTKKANRKNKLWEQCNLKYSEMATDQDINKLLSEASLINHFDNTPEIKLNSIQLEATNKFLQKRYNICQFSMGTGKTIMSLFMIRQKQIKTFVIAPSIAINGTWEDMLKTYGFDFHNIKAFRDIQDINKHQITIISINLLHKYKRYFKQYIKTNKNVFTIIDESDIMTNPNSQRTKAIIDCFKYSRNKLLLSGTTCRNNIAEIFSQLSFLYLSSEHFINWSEYKIIINKDGEQEKIKNNEYGKPFKMFLKGFKTFKECFNPEKITVFGIGKLNQDIFNSDVLNDITDRIILTKTFEEVTNNHNYKFKQTLVNFNLEESNLYDRIINEFSAICGNFYSSTGNIRKDALLKIIRQLKLLIRACATPHILNSSVDYCNKFNKVLSLIKESKEKYIAIGTTHKASVESYKQFLNENLPELKVYTITGEVSIKKRIEIKNELEQTGGILISTQQALSCSLNIDFLNYIIIPELLWNMSATKQYIFRFIRMTSKDNKLVEFVTYSNSIESNILQLLVTKEKLVNQMKNNKSDSYEDIYSEFGIDFDVLQMLLTKEKDAEGKIKINWGQQNIL
ncbi:SNF2-related protein [Dolichospermum sp. ST_sed1]|nr:SNF2-related protein [Dolichospermum sp. ST_sed1]